MTALNAAIIIVLGIAVLVGLDILVNKLKRRKRARKWKDKQKRVGW